MSESNRPGTTIYMHFMDARAFGAVLVFEGLRDASDEQLGRLGFRRRPPSVEEAGRTELATQFAAIALAAQTGELPLWPIEALADKARQMYEFHRVAPMYEPSCSSTRSWTREPIPVVYCREFGTGTFAFMLLQRLRAVLRASPRNAGSQADDFRRQAGQA